MQVITTVLLSYKVLRVLLSPVKTKQTSFFSCKNLADQKERKWGGGGGDSKSLYIHLFWRLGKIKKHNWIV